MKGGNKGENLIAATNGFQTKFLEVLIEQKRYLQITD
jgi:hypothetical protein